jgi:DeoR family fructose operon transcriptional repressor
MISRTEKFTIDFNHKTDSLPWLKVPLHLVVARRQKLAAWVRHQSFVPVQQVCEEFSISEATARRDLTALARQKQLVRTYGGALGEYSQRFPSFLERKKSGAASKRSVAKQARALIEPETTVFLDAGTTIFALAMELQRHPLAIEVVTNSLPIAELLASVAQIRVHLLGGHFLARQSVLLGPAACHALSRYKIDQAFLSAEALDGKGAWNSQDEVVALQTRVLDSARESILCIHQAKLGQTAPCFLAAKGRFHRILSDTPAAKPKRRRPGHS